MSYKKSTDEAVNTWMDGLGSPMLEIVIKARDLALAADEHIEESIKWRDCLVFRYKKNLIQTVVGKDKVTFIFFEGVQLDDSHGLLEGDGKKTRSVRYTSDSFDAQAFTDLVKQAVALNK